MQRSVRAALLAALAFGLAVPPLPAADPAARGVVAPAAPACSPPALAFVDPFAMSAGRSVRLHREERQQVELAPSTVVVAMAIAPLLADPLEPGELTNRTVSRIEVCALASGNGAAWRVVAIGEREIRNVSIERTVALSAIALVRGEPLRWTDLADLTIVQERRWLAEARAAILPEGSALLDLLVLARRAFGVEPPAAPPPLEAIGGLPEGLDLAGWPGPGGGRLDRVRKARGERARRRGGASRGSRRSLRR